ncbi:hypothetical protein AGDE_14899 [Angomonas deanei]|nr:hypothetical protein AGDE_14899 [Angomonas deanei]|eukprot:EPY20027.1 hypothetical protein AGDE_14899 [Angomonas deanei]
MREGTATAQEGPEVNEWIDAGPIYFDACKHHEPYRAALLKDCERCGVSLAELLQLRCERVAPLLPMRHSLSLLPYYSSEAGLLQRTMESEFDFFHHEVLQKDPLSPQA